MKLKGNTSQEKDKKVPFSVILFTYWYFLLYEKKVLTLKNKYGRQKPIVQGLEGVGLGGSVLRLNPECRILNPENTVPDPHNWRYAKSIPPQIAIEQNRRTERKKNKMGTKKMKLQLKIVFRINSPHHANVYKFSQLCGALSPLT